MATFNSPSDSSFKPQMELIFSDTVTAATQASFSTGTLQTGYKAYKLIILGRTDIASYAENLEVRINGDNTAGNYGQRRIYGSVGGLTTNLTGGDGVVGFLPGASAPAAHFGQTETVFVSPEETTAYKTWTVYSNQLQDVTQYRKLVLAAGSWSSTAAITSMVITPDSGGALVTGSSLHVYGIK